MAALSGSETPVRAVLLDCLGTLLRLEPPGRCLRAELARRGIVVSEEAASEAFRAEIAYYLDHHLEGSTPAGLERLRDACARVVAESLGADERIADVRAAMLAALRFTPYPDAVPALRALRAERVRLVVTSNWDRSLPEVLEATGLRHLVDAVVTSAEVGRAKPDPAIFDAALQAAGCPPRAATCIGDSLEADVLGARAAGVAAVLLARERRGSEAVVGRGRGEVVLADGARVPVIGSLDEARSVVLAGA